MWVEFTPAIVVLPMRAPEYRVALVARAVTKAVEFAGFRFLGRGGERVLFQVAVTGPLTFHDGDEVVFGVV